MINIADPDELASSKANWSGSTLFAKGRVFPGSAGQGLENCVFRHVEESNKSKLFKLQGKLKPY